MSEKERHPSPSLDEKDTRQVDPVDSDPENSVEIKSIEETSAPAQHNFPEGGLRAWSVAIGAAGVIFCTFGYANAFGYAFFFDIFHCACGSDHKQCLPRILSNASTQRYFAVNHFMDWLHSNLLLVWRKSLWRAIV
jgi:hypothetical protein